MVRVWIRAWITALLVDLRLRLHGFRYIEIALARPKSHRKRNDISVDRLLAAVDSAVAWSLARGDCLRRSLVGYLLLTDYGWPAKLVIGVQNSPFGAHAWLELDDVPINDRPSVRTRFTPFRDLT